MDDDQPDATAAAEPTLLLHETVVGRPSPPASFLATVRLRKPCNVSTIVVVPDRQSSFEYATLDSYGSTPRAPADIDLYFNVRFAPPAATPPNIRANKLQKVVLEYRPETEDVAGRLGGQAFVLAMPKGVSTSLLIFRSSLPVITILLYGGQPATTLPPLPEPDWSTYLRLRDGAVADRLPETIAFQAVDAHLPAVRLLAKGWDVDDWCRLYGGLAALDGSPTSDGGTSARHPLQDRLENLFDILVQGGKELTDWLKRSKEDADVKMRANDEASTSDTSPEPDPTPPVRLALVHIVELLASVDLSDTSNELIVPANGTEVVLVAVLLLLSAEDRSDAACALAAGVVLALLGSNTTRDVVLAHFAASASGLGSQQPAGSVWDLGLWASVFGVTPATHVLRGADGASFADLVRRLETSTPALSLDGSSSYFSPAPTALLALLAASVQISGAGAVVADLVHAAGPPTLSASSVRTGLDGEDLARLKIALRSLLLWSTSRTSAFLCQTLLARPSILHALCLLVAHSGDALPIGGTAVAVLDHVLSNPSTSIALAAVVGRLSAETLSRLRLRIAALSLVQIDVARAAIYPRHAWLTVKDLAEEVRAHTLSVQDMFQLQLWLHHLAGICGGDTAGKADILLGLHESAAQAQRRILGQDTSFARDQLAGRDRVGALLSLGRLNALVLESLKLVLCPGTEDPTGASSGPSASDLSQGFLARRATRCVVDTRATAAHVSDPAFLDAFCLHAEQSDLLATIKRQTQACGALLQSLVTARPSRHSHTSSVLDGLLDAALADPAVAATSTVDLLLQLLAQAAAPLLEEWAMAIQQRRDTLKELSIFLHEAHRDTLARALSAISPNVHILTAASSSTFISTSISAQENLAPPTSADSAPTDPLVVSQTDLLHWLFSPSLTNTSNTTPPEGTARPLSQSPQKKAFALSDSPPTSKTYKQQEFRAARTVPGAGGLVRVGNVSRAPSRHVDEFESALAPTPTPSALLFRKDTT